MSRRKFARLRLPGTRTLMATAVRLDFGALEADRPAIRGQANQINRPIKLPGFPEALNPRTGSMGAEG